MNSIVHHGKTFTIGDEVVVIGKKANYFFTIETISPKYLHFQNTIYSHKLDEVDDLHHLTNKYKTKLLVSNKKHYDKRFN